MPTHKLHCDDCGHEFENDEMFFRVANGIFCESCYDIYADERWNDMSTVSKAAALDDDVDRADYGFFIQG